MTDAKTKAEGADVEAPDAEKTDEQLWDELGSEEASPDADDADADDAKDIEAKADDADEPAPDETDSEPGPSDDDSDGDGKTDAPDGTDRETLQAQNERLQQVVKSDQGRLAYGEREIKRLRSQIDFAPKAQSDDQSDDHLKERKEKLAAAQEEYGDVIGPLAETVKALETRLDEAAAQETKNLEQQRERYDNLVADEIKVFESEHQDGFETIVKNRKVFDEWIDDQPRALRDIYAANQQDIVNGTQAAYLVTRFKQALLGVADDPAPANPETERLQDRRQRQLAGALSPRTSSTQAASSRPAKDSNDLQGHWDSFRREEQREEREKR